ncbi:MAG: hypothetical protein AAGI09_12645 [Pseudomonadota bacterium]
MTTVPLALLLITSLLGLGYIAATDPKRRRAFGQTKLETRPFLWPARGAVFAPGVLLLLGANWSGFTIWAGAVTVLGWIMAAIAPSSYAAAWRRLRREGQNRWHGAMSQVLVFAAVGVARARRAVHAAASLFRQWLRRPATHESAALHARVAALEARLEALENAQGAGTPTNPVSVQATLNAAE